MTYLFPDSVLMVFCKAPIVGQVKTRLQPALTAEQSVAAHMELTRVTLDRAFRQPLCPVQLYCSPDTKHAFFQECAEDHPLTLATQCGGELGARMQQAFEETLENYRCAILIGCDCPSLTVDDLYQALMILRNGYEAVVGPAEDGGYVLIGLNAPQPILFKNMPWGTDQVMAETRRRSVDTGLNLQELDVQWDVDHVDDWYRYLRLKTN